MNHRLLKLFEKAERVGFSLEYISVLTLFLAITTATAQAQSVASSVTLVNPKSEISGIAQTGSGGMLGVYLGDINEARAKELKLADARGVVIGKIEEGSPAAKAGLQQDDVIRAFNDHPIYNPTQFYKLLTESSAGAVVSLSIVRSGVSQAVRVTLGPKRAAQRSQNENIYATADAYLGTANERVKEASEARQRGDEKEAARLEFEGSEFRKLSEDSRAAVDKDIREGRVQLSSASKGFSNNVASARYQLGVRVSPLNEQLAAFFNVRSGVLINEVRVGGIAESSGIKAGDCIVAVGKERVETLADLNRLVDQASDKGSAEATLSIVRDRTELTVKVKFEAKFSQR
ncbi:MAG: PDZ domain-containing protein [Blastocatellia bacterium]